jgi:predicted dehydrogenase
LGGRKASLSVSDMYLWRHTLPDGHWKHPFAREHHPLDGSRAYVNQLDHFLAVIARDAEPLVSARDGMMTLAATLAIASAAREDRSVSVADFAAHST